MGPYQPFFSITAEHTYFATTRCNTLLLKPCPSTKLLMKNVGLLLKDLTGGVRGFYDQDKTQALKMYIEENEGQLSLEFKVTSSDRNFHNYTDFWDSRHGGIVYLENENCEEDNSGRVCLHKDEYIPEQSYISVKSPLLEGVLGHGEYFLPPLLVIRVNLDGCLIEGANPENRHSEKKFFFRLRGRKTYWKYYVLGHRSNNTLHVTDSNGQVEFEALGDKLLPHNTWAKIFRSTTAISLCDRPAHCFQLHENIPGAGRVVVKRMPGPSVEQVGREDVHGTTAVVSEIYVNC